MGFDKPWANTTANIYGRSESRDRAHGFKGRSNKSFHSRRVHLCVNSEGIDKG